MHKTEAVFENKTNKIHWDLEMQTYYAIQTKRREEKLRLCKPEIC